MTTTGQVGTAPSAPVRAERSAAPGFRGHAAWSAVGLLILLVVALGLAGFAYILLSGAGMLPRPAPLLPWLPGPMWAGPQPVAAGTAAAVLALLVVFGAVLRAGGLRRNRLLAGALHADPAGRAITGRRGRVVYANPAFERLMGPGAAQRFAQLEELSGGREGAGHLAHLRRIAGSGGAGQVELCVPGMAGALQWLRIIASPIGSRRGYTLWCIDDITTRREMEHVIREERARLVDFLEHAPVGCYSVDAEGRFEYANTAIAEWLGFGVGALIASGPRLSDILGGAADPERPWSPFRSGNGSGRGEVTLRRSDGTTFPAEVVQGITGRAEDGSLRTRSIVRDLTAVRELEQRLDAAESRFRRLFEDAPTGIAILDLDGTVAGSNRAFRNLVSLPDGAAGAQVASLVEPPHRQAVAALLAEVADGKPVPGPLDVQVAGREEASAALHAARLDDAAGQPSGLIVYLAETTQHRRLEQQFAQSQKMQAVGQLAGGIAHDFNNLLTVMIGFCDLILQRHRPGEQTFADIMQIKQNANRAANLVRQLLAFSRRQTLQPKVLNITDVLAELAHLLRRLIGVDIALDVVHGRDLGLVKVDQVQLEQVIINLAVNARDAMKDTGGRLTIRTANITTERPARRGADIMPPGDYVELVIADTGTGIPPEIQERIFEPFFSTKEVGQGTGLGLSTVYGIVTQTGGFVQLDSEVGRGTTFSIYLPRYEAPTEPAAPAGEPRRTMARDLSGVGTVLLVEDEDPVRLFGARALRNKGYQVLEAKNGDAALRIMAEAEAPIDLIISDVVMPQRDGPSLIREVRETWPGMKVIFISGYAEDDFRVSLEREAGIHFLAKPFSLEQLAAKVKEVMEE